ncbi:staygreen family protein [Heyndrickxia acidicola]|uniref:Staygreen family protein n=1 Tax=Heyndrickxia acidicola TaxID=209389 RepID=A0ABU6MDG7_9BACI|nr:staygreen family protein [Heyndrickxia acidicola]MED1202349.1 staygreen family protein [Heyndrickxia acidicola]
MKIVNPEKVHVEYRNRITPISPILSRRYTLTHSDTTGDLFLTLGEDYALDKIPSNRDEVLGEWIYDGSYSYYAKVHVDDPVSPENNQKRNQIFIKELPLALQTIRYGDNSFFRSHSFLDLVPIRIYFESVDPSLNRIEYWGNFSNYRS